MPRPAIFIPPPSSDEYLQQIATIFAAAILRRRSRKVLPADTSPKLSESTSNCLESCRPMRLNGVRG